MAWLTVVFTLPDYLHPGVWFQELHFGIQDHVSSIYALYANVYNWSDTKPVTSREMVKYERIC